ncbi:hypothetical protein L3X38_024983 [Prunus dulcis]|uniref:Uncharacterized protein n=1 Tax=Prunus dulcis TaxID=3755 RepID=A0AAD4W0W5_PRUDU|nr:hypothetical protein L3X38_024983 [Prunus dulcis]
MTQNQILTQFSLFLSSPLCFSLNFSTRLKNSVFKFASSQYRRIYKAKSMARRAIGEQLIIPNENLYIQHASVNVVLPSFESLMPVGRASVLKQLQR